MMNRLVAVVLGLALLLAGCSGGSSNPNTSGSSSSGSQTSTAGQAQGVYSGTSSNNYYFESIVLPNDMYYAIYGTVTGNVFYIYGIITGQGASGSSTYTASVNDFMYTGSTYSGTVSASYVPGSTLSGTINESGSTISFAGSVIPASQFNYNSAASLSSVTGSWTGTLLDGSSATVTIASNGSFSGTNGGCVFSGTISPNSSKNYFTVSITFGGSPCLLPNQTASGIGITYLLSNGVNRQLVFGGVSGNKGTVFVATR